VERERLANAERTQVSTQVTHSVGMKGQEEDEGIGYYSDPDNEVI
jgi:hypothetical protein